MFSNVCTRSRLMSQTSRGQYASMQVGKHPPDPEVVIRPLQCGDTDS
jgi:hypothetical protein